MITLKIKCKCGQLLRVPDTLAGKKVGCPACKRAYRLSHEKFGLATPTAAVNAEAGSAAPAATKPVVPNRAATVAPPETLELPSIDPLMTPSELNLLEGLDLPSPNLGPVCPECKQAQPTGAKICVRCGIDLTTGRSILDGKKAQPAELGYAGTRGRRTLRGRGMGDIIEEPKRGFWKDLLYAFAYPFASVGNALNMVVLAVANVVAPFFCFGPFLDLYMAAFYMNVVSDTACGHDDLKAAPIEMGLWDGFVKPWLGFAAAFLLAMAPNFLYGLLVALGALQQNIVILMLWTAFGVMLWPMFMLLAALSQWSLLVRPHVLIVTVFQSLFPYLAICTMLFLAFALYSVSSIGQQLLVRLGIQSFDLFKALFGVVGGMIAAHAIYLYFMTVGMRLVGLYYLHFKKRFAFKLE